MMTFDLALPTFAQLVADVLGEQALANYFFLRDVSGKLTLIVPDRTLDPAAKDSLARRAHELVCPYVDGDGLAVATPSELFDERLRAPDDVLSVRVHVNERLLRVRVLDRRMIGSDWLRDPAVPRASRNRLAFVSLKGGVGRTTALCVLAADLIAQGRRILAIDLDLEAPGLGNMLLRPDTLPRFGMLDYVVEQGLGPVDDQFVEDMIGASWLGAGRGRLDVIPAVGQLANENPENVLGKIARAYLASTDKNGNATTFTDHIALALDRVSASRAYDAILIDARAGLHETTAASIVGLGAKILLFGVDQPQTYADYRLLFAHLETLGRSVSTQWKLTTSSDTENLLGTAANGTTDSGPHPREDDAPPFSWQDTLLFVHAKASTDVQSQDRFIDRMSELVGHTLVKAPDPLARPVDVGGLANEFDVEWDDTDIDQVPVPAENGLNTCRILNDDHYASFDPLGSPDLLDALVYKTTYQPFIDACRSMLGLENAES
ncbi:AAA family ATPase [Burkholderia sola]|uniref:KGGVGR-motif variant AAA ATPase n=1 Tax=Burkholderia TaxID=32008 RepID=UPI001AE6ACDE|nr:AAA family ATPase [Burkholderia sp. AcTa6-5]MBP0715160.1 AAA family ATPase [Burkholderia sp. AcTa6-5]